MQPTTNEEEYGKIGYNITETVQRHGRALARHEQALSNLQQSVDRTNESIKQTNDMIVTQSQRMDSNFNEFRETLQESSKENRPDIKWMAGTMIALVMLGATLFTIILNLTQTPIKESINSLSNDIIAIKKRDDLMYNEYSKLIYTEQARTTEREKQIEMFTKNLDQRHEEIKGWMTGLVNGQTELIKKTEKLRADVDNLDIFVRTVDEKGTRWVRGQINKKQNEE